MSKKSSQHIFDLGGVDSPSEGSRRRIFMIFRKISILKIYNQFKAFIVRKKQERLTLMFVPHTNKTMKSYHVSNLALSILAMTVVGVLFISSWLIIGYTSTVQELDYMKVSQGEAKVQLQRIRKEIHLISHKYSLIKKSLSELYNLSQGFGEYEKNFKSKSSTFLGQGGASIPLYDSEPESIISLQRDQEKQLGVASKAVSDTTDNNSVSQIESNVLPTELFILNHVLENMKNDRKPLRSLKHYIKKRLYSIRLTPTLYPVLGYVINPYGYIRMSDSMNVTFNNGVDIVATPGAKVVTTAAGKVVDIKRIENSIQVRIKHSYGYETVYNGLANINVQLQDKVSKGETIGFLGLSNSSSDAILHYQIYLGTESQDPSVYMYYTMD